MHQPIMTPNIAVPGGGDIDDTGGTVRSSIQRRIINALPGRALSAALPCL
jgi:hypothetical protein